MKNPNFRLDIERLEDRCVPAILSSQNALKAPLLEAPEVAQLLDRASVATASNDAIIVVADRNGRILGVRVEADVFTNLNLPVVLNLNDLNNLTDDQKDLFYFSIDGAVAKARTAAFFANDTAPLTSRTIQLISQTTISEREVESNPNLADPLLNGPGFVAPISVGGHFPPGIANTPQVDLFAIEHTNRDSLLLPGPDMVKGTADDISIPNNTRFNIDPAQFVAGKVLYPPISFGEAILAPNTLNVVGGPDRFQARGIGTLPGGIPLYQYGTLVGGIGVFFPGTTGFANEENSILSNDHNPAKPDRTLEAEFMGLAAAGGSKGAGFPVGTLGGFGVLPGFDIPFGSINLVGIALDVIGPGGINGPSNLVTYAKNSLGVGQGVNSGVDLAVNVGGDFQIAGKPVPQGWIVAPHAGVGITKADVVRIIGQGVTEANRVRAQIRLPNNERTRMVLAVADSTGEVLGLFRMPDSTVFSIDVAVAKSRNTAYYNSNELLKVDQLPGVAKGTSFTNRTFRFLSQPRYPEGIDGAPPPAFSSLNDPGINPLTGRQVGPIQPNTAYTSVLGYDSFHVGTNFRDPKNPENQNGIVFFPGSSSVYKNTKKGQIMVGGFGVSGDGVDQDDVVTSFGIKGYTPLNAIRVDQVIFNDVRLPFQKFPRNPEG